MRPNFRFSIIYFSIVCLLFLFVPACKKDKSDPSPPIVTTRGVTEITPHSAKFGGNIDSDGKETVTASGFCYSKVNPTPTVEDDTTQTPAVSGGFVSDIKDLEPSTIYYFRAYAINSLGIGYGEVNSFSTTNAPPVASDIMITGSPEVDSILTASYTYSDIENDLDSGTSFQWYSARDTLGTEETPIAGAIYSTYTVLLDDSNRFIRVGVTPAALTGTSPGSHVKSHWVGPVKFSITNAPPVASDIAISGSTAIDSILTTTYSYSDNENDQEGGTVFQWYSATDTIGGEEVPVVDAVNPTYTIIQADSGRFIRVGVTPAALTGTTPGSQVKSIWVGPVVP